MPEFDKPHVVILGAGASKAAFPEGDAIGNIVPVMNELTKAANLKRFFEHRDMEDIPDNFEELYSRIFAEGDKKLLEILEFDVWQYFAGMVMPTTPTLYDHLMISLRDKDLIATFNWDPFLIEARQRSRNVKSLPHLVFLHGCTRIGYCQAHNEYGVIASRCPVCNKFIEPIRLLYPVLEKDYNQNVFIKGQWTILERYLQDACILTIFGYGAPTTDVEAVALMKKAWGPVEKRSLEQIEIIDIKGEDELRESWKQFIHTGHCETKRSFYESYIARFPRRSGEAFKAQFMDAEFISGLNYPKTASWDELDRIYDPLFKEESSGR